MSDLLNVEIQSLGNRVGGISRGGPSGTVFVRGALPGEKVICRVRSRKKNRIEADLLEVLDPSPARRTPFCSHYGECGGCSLQHLDYDEQLRWKREWVNRALDRSGIDPPSAEPVMPSPSTEAYRNRVSFDIVEGRPGLHRFRGDPMPVDRCPLLIAAGTAALDAFRGTDLSSWRRLSIRASGTTGDSMVEFRGETRRTRPPSPAGINVTAWMEGGEWRSSPPGGFLTERLAGMTFPLFPGSFCQVNTGAAELLVKKILASSPTSGRVLDLYGGVGTFSLPLAGSGCEVTSVELSGEASLSGRRACDMNGIETVDFVNSRVRTFLTGDLSGESRWDAVVADPPRAGLGVRISRLVRRLDSPLLLMVSCDPFSLGRDLREITAGGWQVRRVQPLDMFPQTDHVETLTTLVRS